jgi:hypothetical protein
MTSYTQSNNLFTNDTNDANDADVVNILVNMHNFMTKPKFSMNDLASAEKDFHNEIMNYNIIKNKIYIILKKYGINSDEYRDLLNIFLQSSNKKDEAQYKYENIKKSLNL